MRKLLFIFCLFCLSITGYSQSTETLKYIEYFKKEYLQVNRDSIANNYYHFRYDEVSYKLRWTAEENKEALGELLKIIQDSINSHSNYLRAKSRAELGLVEEEQVVIQNKVFNLTPRNMINYLGKVNKEEFEKLVGMPVGEEEGFIVYEIDSKYEEIPIAIRCGYNEKTGKLIHVRFPTPILTGYELGFIHFPEYKKWGSHKVYKNQFNKTYRVDYKYKGFGAQIFYSGIVIYHLVK